MRHRLVPTALATLALAGCTLQPRPPCSAAYVDRIAHVARRGCAKTWTVLVYMALDAPDLEAPAQRDWASMEDPTGNAGSTAQADVVLELARSVPARTLRLHVLRTAPPGAARSPVVERLDENAGAEPTPPHHRLARFVSWGMEHYPARHYAVVVWGHGLGFRPAGSSGPGLDTPGLRRALLEAGHGCPVDLYASDACLMQSVEVAGELHGVARYVVGSEHLEEDYVGLPYRAWLPMLNGSVPLPIAPACPYGDVACHAAAALPAVQSTDETPGYTLSALDEEALERQLVPALRALGGALEGYAQEDDLRRVGLRVLLGPARGKAHGTPGFRGGTRDVGVFLERLMAAVEREPGAAGSTRTQGVLDAAAAARTALQKTVIAASFGRRYQAMGLDAMAGVSLWLPHDEGEYRARRGIFATSVLHQGSPSLKGFLERLFAPTH